MQDSDYIKTRKANIDGFNRTLKNLPGDATGVYKVYVRGDHPDIEYRPLTREFSWVTDLGGYTKGSLVSLRKLTAAEEDELYDSVGKGVEDIWLDSRAQTEPVRIFHGKFNLPGRK